MMNKSTKGSKIPLIIDSNTKTIYPTDIPNQFNKYFTELEGKLSSDIPPATSTRDRYFTDFECPINTLTLEVLRLLSCVTTSKAAGLDQVSAKSLKIVAPVIMPSLTLIFNQSIRTWLFPFGNLLQTLEAGGLLQNRGLRSPENLSLSSRNFAGLSCLPVTK